MADDLLFGVNVDLVWGEGVLLVLPLGKRVFLLLARGVHGRVVAVVQRARVIVLRTLLLFAMVLHRVQQVLHRGRHGCRCRNWAGRRGWAACEARGERAR